MKTSFIVSLMAILMVLQMSALAQTFVPGTPGASLGANPSSQASTSVEVIKIDQSTQTGKLMVMESGKPSVVKLSFSAATGWSKKNQTPNGTYKVKNHKGKDFKNSKGQPMPFALCIDEDRGIFAHGTDSVMWYTMNDGTVCGIPQSAGCIRLRTEDAENLSKMVQDGCIVQIVGDPVNFIESSGIKKLLGEDGKLKISVDKPSDSDVKAAREEFLKGNLYVIVPQSGSRKRQDLLVGYPFLTDSCCMSFDKFEKTILTPEERRSGKHIAIPLFGIE